ncbi:MAG TPA: hypothetical protein PLQ93_13455 [Bacteroidia bacterium]|nr:hypothetical protein [Bacteroidia bacterium]
MLNQDMMKYMLAPQSLKQEDLSRLQKLVLDFPYFQPAHLLLSIAARMWDATVFQQSLHRTALVATDRNHLYNLIQDAERSALVNGTTAKTEEGDKRKNADENQAIILQELELVNSAQARTESVEMPEKPAQQAEVVPDPDQIMENEILKQRTVAIVEKEIIQKETTEVAREADMSGKSGSFADWLHLLKQSQGIPLQERKREKNQAEAPEPVQNKETGTTDVQKERQKQKQRALIDKIIESSPGVIRPKEEAKFFTPEKKAKESLLENEHLVTETLAKIYAMQGNIAKAIRSYEILSLKYPQKSAYFASLIQNLKNNT